MVFPGRISLIVFVVANLIDFKVGKDSPNSTDSLFKVVCEVNALRLLTQHL